MVVVEDYEWYAGVYSTIGLKVQKGRSDGWRTIIKKSEEAEEVNRSEGCL